MVYDGRNLVGTIFVYMNKSLPKPDWFSQPATSLFAFVYPTKLYSIVMNQTFYFYSPTTTSTTTTHPPLLTSTIFPIHFVLSSSRFYILLTLQVEVWFLFKSGFLVSGFMEIEILYLKLSGIPF